MSLFLMVGQNRKSWNLNEKHQSEKLSQAIKTFLHFTKSGSKSSCPPFFWWEVVFLSQRVYEIKMEKKMEILVTHFLWIQHLLLYIIWPNIAKHNFTLHVYVFEMNWFTTQKKKKKKERKKAHHLFFSQQIFAGIVFTVTVKLLQLIFNSQSSI